MNTIETVQTETLSFVTGGVRAGWGGMITNALGGNANTSKGIGEMLGGGGGGLNGKGGGLAETVGGWGRSLFGGNSVPNGGVVEGK